MKRFSYFALRSIWRHGSGVMGALLDLGGIGLSCVASGVSACHVAAFGSVSLLRAADCGDALFGRKCRIPNRET